MTRAGQPLRANRRGQQVNAHPLAERADGVHRPRGGLAQHGQRVAEQRELPQPRRDRVEHEMPIVAAKPEGVGGGFVLRADPRRLLDDRQALAGDGALGAAEQEIGHAAHRGRDDGDLVTRCMHIRHDGRRPGHGLAAADRRAAELQNQPLTHTFRIPTS
jgi:hypothetical protein